MKGRCRRRERRVRCVCRTLSYTSLWGRPPSAMARRWRRRWLRGAQACVRLLAPSWGQPVSAAPSPKGTPMRMYVMTTGVIFALLVVAHVWRMFVESHLATDPSYIVITLAAALLSLWAGRLVWRSRAP